MITIVLTAQLEEAGQEFESSLHDMLVARGLELQYKCADGDVITIVAKKFSTGGNVSLEVPMDTEPPEAAAAQPPEVDSVVGPEEIPAAIAVASPCEEPIECIPCDAQPTIATVPEVLSAKILIISSVMEIPCIKDSMLHNSTLYVKQLMREGDKVIFSYGNFIYKYPLAKSSLMQPMNAADATVGVHTLTQPLAANICNPSHEFSENTVCCAVILPGSSIPVNMLLTLAQCPTQEDQECLHIGTDITV